MEEELEWEHLFPENEDKEADEPENDLDELSEQSIIGEHDDQLPDLESMAIIQ